MLPWTFGVIAGTLVLTVMAGIVGALLPVAIPTMPATAAWWALLANVLTAAVMAGIAVKSSWTGWRLAVGLFIVLYAVSSFTSLIEAAFFGIFFDRSTAFVLLLRDLVTTLVVAPVLVASTGRFRPSPAAAEPIGWPTRLPARIAGGGALYLVLYFAFGIAIMPFIREFYATKDMPGPLAIIAMQLLVRGPIFAGTMLLVARMIRGPATTNAWYGALVMSIVGGVAPLIVPNPYFPEAVRWAHFCEVSVENFIFGWLVARMMTPSIPDRRQMPHVA